MSDKLKQALFKAYLRYVTILYSDGTEARGYVSFDGPPDWVPLIKDRFFSSYGRPLQTDNIAQITWGVNILYAV